MFVAFTAYLKQRYSSDEARWDGFEESGDSLVDRSRAQTVVENAKNPCTPCHYPTIFFFNIDTQKIQWEIFGAEILVDVIDEHEVIYITSEAWTKAERQELLFYNNADSQSLHADYKSLINVIHWGITPTTENLDVDSRNAKVPEFVLKRSYYINFGKYQSEEIERYKVVEAHLHNDSRVTVIYCGLGSYTFQLKAARN